MIRTAHYISQQRESSSSNRQNIPPHSAIVKLAKGFVQCVTLSIACQSVEVVVEASQPNDVHGRLVYVWKDVNTLAIRIFDSLK